MTRLILAGFIPGALLGLWWDRPGGELVFVTAFALLVSAGLILSVITEPPEDEDPPQS